MAYGSTKYGLIVDLLLQGIKDGTYKVGDTLPTETRLMEAHCVSRNTVRNAIQALRQRGLIESRQGHGSVVIKNVDSVTFVERIQSIDELLRLGKTARRQLIGSRVVPNSPELAEKFSSSVDREFVEIDLLVEPKSSASRPSAVVRVWMDVVFASLVDDLEGGARTVLETMAHKFQRKAGHLRQVVRAAPMPADAAMHLDRPSGECALIVERYYSEHAEKPPFLVSRTINCADLVSVEASYSAS